MTPPPPLPLEIYYKIMSQITRNKYLCALSLCCRALCDEAQRELFRHPANSDLSFVQQAAFFDAIISSPLRLGPMVKSYTIRRLANDQPDIKQARHAAGAALPLMCNLTTLKIDNVACIDMSILLGCSFQLDMLIFGRGDHNREIEPLLFDFLRKQSSLRHLTLCGGKPDTIQTQFLRDDRTWCPNLMSLGVEEGLMDLFLAKHRPIRHLDWYNSWELPSGLSTLQLFPHLSSLKYLSCTMYSIQANISVLQEMRSLVLLDVFLKDLDGGELLRKLRFLQNTPQLRYLILAGSLKTFARQMPGPEIPRTAFKLCPTLKHIDMSMFYYGQYSDLVMFDRFYKQDASGEMGVSVVQACDVYAWKAIK